MLDSVWCREGHPVPSVNQKFTAVMCAKVSSGRRIGDPA